MRKRTPLAAAEQPPWPLGRRIVNVRPMTVDEAKLEGWERDMHAPPVVLVLSDGSKLYPSRDSEGNGPGMLFFWQAGKQGALV